MAPTESRFRFQGPRKGISLEILGDSRPFSRFGRSICYLVRIGDRSFLVDCGAPIFEYLSREEIEELDALFATHSHEDHRRWFTDLALYLHYLREGEERLDLVTTDKIHEEYMKDSRGALERTLSPDSREVVEVSYHTFVNQVSFGPSPKYKITLENTSPGKYRWNVVDDDGNTVPKDRAKVVINDPQIANRPRLLFRDPGTDLWVEPQQFYSLEPNSFYGEKEHPYTFENEHSGNTVRITPVKAPVWHGPPTIGIDVQTGNERLVFSSDTVYNPDLWKTLGTEQRELEFDAITRDEFESSRVIYGDINNYIQQSWSERRLERALGYYRNSVTIHDCGPDGNPVHTDYCEIDSLNSDELILTHCPDRFVSEFPVAVTGKKYRIIGNKLLEETEQNRYPLKADIYFRDFESAYVGFENEDGDFKVVRQEDSLDVVDATQPSEGDVLMYVDLYRDMNGYYLPYLEDPNTRYRYRPDRRIERVTYQENGSTATVVETIRAPDGGIREEAVN